MRVFFQSLIALLLVHGALPAADDSKRLLDEANAHYRAFRSAEAIRTYREYLERYPDRADVRVFLGAALLNSGATDAALQECKRAISMDSGHAKAYSLAGRVYSAMNNWPEAQAMFHKSLALNPKDLDTWYFLGRASYSADYPAAAVDSYRHALEYGAPQGRVYEHLGRAYELLGQAADADKSYRRALESAGDSFSPYFAYGTFLFKQGRIADSLPVLEQALRREPGSAEVRLELSRALFHAGEPEQALGVLQPARESNECRVHQLLLRLFTLKANTREADKELNFLETCRR